MNFRVMNFVLILAILLFALLLRGEVTSEATAPEEGIMVKVLFEPSWEFDIVVPFNGGLAAVENFPYGHWQIHDLGYINAYGEIVISPIHRHWVYMYYYRGAPTFTYGVAGIFSQEHEGVAFFDTYGNRLTPFRFIDAKNFSEGLSAVRTGGSWIHTDDMVFIETGEPERWGFVDLSGEIVIPLVFDYVDSFYDGLAVAMRDGRWGVIDTRGNTVIDFQSEEFHLPGPSPVGGRMPQLSEGLFTVWDTIHPGEDEDPWDITIRAGAVDMYGNLVIPKDFGWVRGFVDGVAVVESIVGFDEWPEFGVIDRSGELIVPFGRYREIRSFSEGLASVVTTQNGRSGFIDTNGNEVIVAEFAEARHFSEGRAAFAMGERWDTWTWGFIDTYGNEIVPAVFGSVLDFSEGLAAVGFGDEENRKWGFIDYDGQWVVPLMFDEVQSFSEGLAWFRLGDEWGLLQITTDAELAIDASSQPDIHELMNLREQAESDDLPYHPSEETPDIITPDEEPQITHPEYVDTDDQPYEVHYTAEDDTTNIGDIFLRYWSIIVVVPAFIVRCVFHITKREIPIWIIPTICLSAIVLNVITHFIFFGR